MSDLHPKRAIEEPDKPKWKFDRLTLVIASLAILGVLLLVSAIVYSYTGKTRHTTANPPHSTETTGEDGPTRSQTANTEPCTNFSGSMTAPVEMEIDSMAIESPVHVVGKDAEGNPGAPDPDDAYATAWYNRSAAPGNLKGNVILTIHTYSQGTALGNDLMDPTYGLTSGDVFKIRDHEGNQVCYEYTSQTKVMVDEYDPESGIFHNLEGPPQLAIMICDDYNKATDEWDSRIIFYAELIHK